MPPIIADNEINMMENYVPEVICSLVFVYSKPARALF